MYTKDLEPNCQDEVKSKIAPDIGGTVIAKYKVGTVTYIDIRLFDERIWYASPILNWEVTKPNDE